MSYALARTFSAKQTGEAPARRFAAFARSALAKTAALPRRAYFVIALCGLAAGIGSNALLLQRGRHAAPLFGAGATNSAIVTRVDSAPTAPMEKEQDSDARKTSYHGGAAVDGTDPDPARNQEASASSQTQSSSQAPSHRTDDPISAFLEQHDGQAERLAHMARSALIKLGYGLKPDSSEAEIRRAIRKFEIAHGDPQTGGISQRVVQKIVDAAKERCSRCD